MTATSFRQRSRLPWLLLVSLAVLFMDRTSKEWVRVHIAVGHAITIIPRVFRITHVFNEGAAFSLFADTATPQRVRWTLVAFSLVASAALFAALVRFSHRFTLTTLALAMILGGAVGNAYDRIRYASVIDFIEIHIFRYHWPDFNLADSAIVLGACLLFLDTLLPDSSEQPHAHPDYPAANETTSRP